MGFYFNNATTAKPCDMELQMIDVAGGGLGRDAKDLRTGTTMTSYAEWDTADKSCMTNMRARVAGNKNQSDVLVKDVSTLIQQLN